MFIFLRTCTVYIYICMYVCIYVRTYVCRYVCMYVCMYIYIGFNVCVEVSSPLPKQVWQD